MHKATEVISVESFNKKDCVSSNGLPLFKRFFRIIHKTPILDKDMGGAEIMVRFDRKNQSDSKLWNWKKQILSQLYNSDLAYFTLTSLENRHLSLGISIVFSLELFSFSILDTIQEYSRIFKTEFLFHFSMN